MLFKEFVNKKERDVRKHLQTLEKLFKAQKFEVKSYLQDDFPYIFVKSPDASLSFEGVRIYEIGDMVAYRIAREAETEPYGTAYQLDLENMYNDYMSEITQPEKAGHKVIESVAKEIKTFFKKSADAEEENRGRTHSVIFKTA